MTRLPPPTDPVEALGEASEHPLECLRDELHVRDLPTTATNPVKWPP